MVCKLILPNHHKTKGCLIKYHRFKKLELEWGPSTNNLTLRVTVKFYFWDSPIIQKMFFRSLRKCETDTRLLGTNRSLIILWGMWLIRFSWRKQSKQRGVYRLYQSNYVRPFLMEHKSLKPSRLFTTRRVIPHKETRQFNIRLRQITPVIPVSLKSNNFKLKLPDITFV